MEKDNVSTPIQDLIPDLAARIGEMQFQSASYSGSSGDLDDNRKRWLVVGICLHSIISPAVRKYVEPIIKQLYNSLMVSDQIDTQTYNRYLKIYQPTNTYLLYDAINNNKVYINTRGRQLHLYDYRVSDHIDLSKIFLQQSYLAQYQAFDETCDLLVLLALISTIDTEFPSVVRNHARMVKENVRHPWAHCDFNIWNSDKYISSFSQMEQFIKDISLSITNETEVLGDLNKWKTNGNGIDFLSGTVLGLQLVNEIRQHTHTLAKYAEFIAATTDSKFSIVQSKLKDLEKSLDLQISNLRTETVELKESYKKLKLSYELQQKEHEDIKKEMEKIEAIQLNTVPWNVSDRLEHLKKMCSLSTFTMLLLKGTYSSFENRVYLAGPINTGKSTLASVMIGENIPVNWRSTNGIQMHCGRNGIDFEAKKMMPLKRGSAGHEIFAKLLRGNLEIKNSGTHTHIHSSKFYPVETEVIYQRHSKVNNREETEEAEQYEFERKIQEDMLKEILQGKYKMNITPTTLWDFAGQKDFYVTHQVFLQCRGTFVLMFDGRYGLHDPLEFYKPKYMTSFLILKHWVDSILTYCLDDPMDEYKLPQILFAATHGDFYTQGELRERKLMFIEELTKIFSSNDLHEHIVCQTLYFFDSRNKDDPGIQQLTKHLAKIAIEQPSWGEQMPGAWIPMEIQISNMKAARINFVKKSELQGFNAQNGDLTLTDSQFEHFLEVQHSLGKLLYFKEHGIDDLIIIQPSSLVKVFNSFVTDTIFWPKGKDVKDILPELCKTGMINRTDLYKLWNQKDFKHLLPTEDLRKCLIGVLTHIDILVESKRYSGSEGSAQNYLVPSMIKEEAPSSFFDLEELEGKVICLSYRLKKSSVSNALLFKFLGSVLNVLSIKERDERACLYYKAAVLDVDDDNECRIHMDGNRIIINLINKTSILQISPDLAASLQECLTLILTNVLHFYCTCMGNDVKQVDILKLFDTEVGVPCCNGFCFIHVKKAMKKTTWTCENEKVHATELLLKWILDETLGNEECPPGCNGIPVGTLSAIPSEKHLVRLASVLNMTMFNDFFLHLGMETQDWNNIQYAYRQPVNAMFMALMTWRDKGSMMTFKMVVDALEKVEDNQHHLCKVLTEHTELPEIVGFGFEDTPSDSFLSTLPKKLGNCVLPLGIELGLRINDVEAVFVRYPKDLFSQVYEIIMIWKEKTQENTYSNLMLAIQRVRGKQFIKRNFCCFN